MTRNCGISALARNPRVLVIAALCTIVVVPTAAADNGYAPGLGFPSQPPSSAYLPVVPLNWPPSWRPSGSHAQVPSQPAYPWQPPLPHRSSYPATRAYAPPTRPDSYPLTQPPGWYVRAPQTHASPSYPASNTNRGVPVHTTNPYLAAPSPHAPPSWPVNYQPIQPTNSAYLPSSQGYASQGYAPPFWPVNYSLIQQDGAAAAAPAAAAPTDTAASPGNPAETPGFGFDTSSENTGPFISTQSFCYWNDDLMIDGKAEFPIMGRMNVGEHNSPLPRDRAYGIYKSYNNVLNNSISDSLGNPLGQSARSIDQYLFGYEKTFHHGRSSVELRMPVARTGNSQFAAGFASNDPSIGNLAVIVKRLLYGDDCSAVSVGCGVTMPTGDDTVFSIGDQSFTVQNNAAHVIPFAGLSKQTVDRRSFVMVFGGLDIPARGNQIEFVDPLAGSQDLGKLVDQTLLYLDFTVGHWLYRCPENDVLTGFGLQAEMHYAGTLNDAKSVSGVASGVGWNTGFDFGSGQNRFNSTFAALMLHTELQNRTHIRVGGIFPLNDADDRFFDSELIVGLVQDF